MLGRFVESRLEAGAFDSGLAKLASAAFAAFASPVRELRLPPATRVIGIGGATLGGSGKTPVVLALARALAERDRVAVVGHGYRARTGAPRRVSPSDDVTAVGDDALWLARALEPLGVPVVVASSRQLALDAASRMATTVLVDGLLQARPCRLARSVLVLDGDRPFGAEHCPPAGDLRAPVRALLEACDDVLVGPGAASLGAIRDRVAPRPVLRYDAELVGAREPDGRVVGIRELAQRRLGLALAIANPERVLRALAAHGVHPSAVSLGPDHGVPRVRADRAARPEAWLTTAKCATKLGDRLGTAPVWVLEQELRLPPELAPVSGGGDGCSASRSW